MGQPEEVSDKDLAVIASEDIASLANKIGAFLDSTDKPVMSGLRYELEELFDRLDNALDRWAIRTDVEGE